MSCLINYKTNIKHQTKHYFYKENIFTSTNYYIYKLLYLQICTFIKTLHKNKSKVNYINFSEHESKILGLRIARTDILTDFDVHQLIDELFEMNVDVCRMKIDISNIYTFNNLEKLCFPYGFYSFLIKQTIDLDKLDSYHYETDIEIRPFDASKKNELYNLVLKVLENDDLNKYYHNEVFDKLLAKDSINHLIADFQTTFDNNIDSKKFGFLAYDKNELIGFSTLMVGDENAEGVFVGILPNHRSKDIFKNFIRAEIVQSKLSGCKTFNCSTIAFNSRSLNSTLKHGLKINQVILNLNIFPLLGLTDIFSFKVISSIINIQESIRNRIISLNFFNELTILEFKINIREKRFDVLNWNINVVKNNNIIIFYDMNKKNFGFIKFEF